MSRPCQPAVAAFLLVAALAFAPAVQARDDALPLAVQTEMGGIL